MLPAAVLYRMSEAEKRLLSILTPLALSSRLAKLLSQATRREGAVEVCLETMDELALNLNVLLEVL